MVNISLNDFIERLFQADLKQELIAQGGGELIVDTSWEFITRHIGSPRPEVIIGRMMALSVETGVKIHTTDGDKPPILNYEPGGPGLHSLSQLNRVLALEQFDVSTPERLKQKRITLEQYVENRLTVFRFYGILYLGEQTTYSAEIEGRLKALAKKHDFPLEITSDKAAGIQLGLKALWRRLMKSLNW